MAHAESDYDAEKSRAPLQAGAVHVESGPYPDPGAPARPRSDADRDSVISTYLTDGYFGRVWHVADCAPFDFGLLILNHGTPSIPGAWHLRSTHGRSPARPAVLHLCRLPHLARR